MKVVKVLVDDDGLELRKGTKVMVQGGSIIGIITQLYNDNSVDVRHDDSHSGPVTDSFSVIDHDVRSLKEIDCVVSVIASGYEWTCPVCNTLNNITCQKAHVKCSTCCRRFKTEPADHCYE